MEQRYEPTPAGMRALLADYVQDVQALVQKRSPWDGLLGTGMPLGREACHGAFSDAFTALVSAAAAQPVAADDAAAMARQALEAPLTQPENGTVRLMLEAVQGELVPLVGLLTPARAAELCAWYRETYPRGTLLPSQHKLLDALTEKGRADAPGKKRARRFPFFP